MVIKDNPDGSQTGCCDGSRPTAHARPGRRRLRGLGDDTSDVIPYDTMAQPQTGNIFKKPNGELTTYGSIVAGAGSSLLAIGALKILGNLFGSKK